MSPQISLEGLGQMAGFSTDSVLNWWFEAVCCDINSEITLAWLNTRKCVSPKFHSEIQKLCFKNFSKIRQIMA